MTEKNKAFLGPFKEKTQEIAVLDCVANTDVYTRQVPVSGRYEISFGRRFTTSTGAALAYAAGDVATVTVSCDGGVTYHSPNTEAGTAVTMDGNAAHGRTVITDSVTHIGISMALLGADETQLFNIMCVDE